MRVLGAALLALLLEVGLSAQILTPFPKTVTTQDSGTACSVVGTCASWPVTTYPTLLMQITGTWTGTLTFEATGDGQTWVAILVTNQATGSAATTTTANGQFAVANTGIVGFRARATAAMTGGANITVTRGASSLARATIGAGSFPLVAPTGSPQYVFSGFLTTGLGINGANPAIWNGGAIFVTFANPVVFAVPLQLVSAALAGLGTPPNGSLEYCSDCLLASNPCTAASTGALAKRINGAWVC